MQREYSSQGNKTREWKGEGVRGWKEMGRIKWRKGKGGNRKESWRRGRDFGEVKGFEREDCYGKGKLKGRL